MPITPTTPLLGAAAIAIVCAAPAAAQDAAEILLSASSAVEQAPGGTARATLSAVAPEQFQITMPSATAQVSWRRADGDTPAALRVEGVGRPRQNQDEQTFDVSRVGEEMYFIDHQRAQRVTRPVTARADQRLSLPQNIDVDFLIAERPLRDAVDQGELVYEGEATVGTEVCDVVKVTMPRPEGAPRPKFTFERWSIARSDNLPRRIDRVNEIPMFGTITTTVELSQIQTQTPPIEEAFEIALPEGYADIGNRNARPRRVIQERAMPNTAAPARRQAGAINDRPTAPTFALTDVSGKEYTNASQRGRVTVLYYWGTWCIPCVSYSPLVSELAQAYPDKPVDVLGLAVKESNPDRVKSFFSSKGYAHTLVLGADRTLLPFRIRVYPTVVVIGPDGSVRATERPRNDVTPEEVMDAVRAAVDGALADL